MKPKVAIIDYGLGNLFSINQACQKVGLSSTITSDLETIAAADALILPGVGAFGHAMNSLKENNLVSPILEFVHSGRPFMGICLGMQLLFTESEEFGIHKGLDLINGRILSFPKYTHFNEKINVPQIQWNQIKTPKNMTWDNTIFDGVPSESYMHFVHSYYAVPETNSNILAVSEYGGVTYASAVFKDNIIGIQFHPEKSAKLGVKIYQNWANLINRKSY